MNIFHEIRYLFYHWQAKRAAHARRRFHPKIGNISSFLAMLKKMDVPYIVLRWGQDLPLTPEAEKQMDRSGDIDLLVDGASMLKFIKAVAYHPGKFKLDIRSNRQVYGTDTKRITYYPPAMSDELLNCRVEENGSYFRADDKRLLYSFAYYLVYHNGARGTTIQSGIEGLETPAYNRVVRHDRVAELHRLATAAGETLPEQLTLWNLHLWLCERQWNMPFDLLPRYPLRTPFLDALYEKSCDMLEKELDGKKNLCVYLLREDAIKANAQDFIIKAVSERFDIMDIVTLTEEQQQLVIRQTRGGDWSKRKKIRMYMPKMALICHGREELQHRGAVNESEEVKENNPCITFKHHLRDELSSRFADTADFMHGSDNDLESFYYIKIIYGKDWAKKLDELYKW